ncbi:MAG: putative Ig domain-containing protein, partial [Bacteroidetes bacterium]|nr:putative Ig domain-containing protein [Bacteroidota bacterium]
MKIFTRLVIAFFLWANFSVLHAQNIVINELMASNTASIQDEDNSREDWIELHNKGSVSVNLLGYGISDDPALPFKWTFPNVSIAAGQYLIVWASDKNRAVAGQPLHTNFKISGSGEALYLTNASGTTIDTSPAANLPANVSYGRLPNGTGPFVFFGTPTPNTVNSSTGYSGTLNPPTFSQNAGFYTTGFSLNLSTAEPGTTILYTLDGSEPDENNLSGTTYTYKNQYIETPGQSSGPLLNNSYRTFQYSAPLSISDRTSQPNDLAAMSSTFSFNPTYIPSFNVFKSTTVRAKVIKPGYLPSPIITKNYFITPLGSSKYTFPVVSINLNEDRFFGYDNGIFVAGKDFDLWRAANPNGSAKTSQRGNYYLEVNDERSANLSYFVNGNEVINQEVGLKIRGGVSRRFQSKSLTVYARSDYGDDDLDYNFFSNLPYTAYERLTLSNSGGDFFSTMFRDAFLHDLCKELYPEKEAYQPTIAFVNGEYWGILNMRERYDDNYFKRVYNTSAVDFLENDSVVKEGDATHYTAMVNYLNSHSLSTQANYDYIKTQLDPENVADYFIANIFFQNEDWPNNNMFFWRNKIAAYNPAAPYGLDGRWRYMFHDMDNSMSFVFGDYTSNSLQIATSVDTAPNYLNPAYSTLVLRKLLTNTGFKNDFINRFADLLNTSFLTNRTVTRLHEMSAVVRPEITAHSARWKAPSSLSSYDSDIDYEEEFLTERPTWQRDHIRSVFSIQSNITATLNVNDAAQGYIKMNTINIAQGTPGITAANPYPWSGIYFKNIPVKLKAIAKPGYIFSHWSGASTSTDAEITLTPSANFSITANFIADTNTDVFVPIYFWMMDSNIVNGAQLTSLNTTYELAADGVIQYQSCLSGYPYPSNSPNYGKASMERRNNPTSINYRQSVNGNIAYASSNMRGLQIKQPFQSNGLENTLVFQFSTAGYKKPKFTFAAVDEGAASGISVDYSVNAGTPVWITTGLTATSLTLTSAYQLFTVDFSNIATADNNPNFKIRFRFTGSNMTADNGARVTFNNIAVDAVQLKLSYPSPNSYTVGTAITSLNPTTTETILSYSVSPALPAGLTLNSTTGIISGTPTVVSPTTTYTVTGTKASGSVSFGVVISVNEAAPSNLSYPSPNVFTVNSAIANLSPTISGGAVLSYSVLPALPSGLSMNVLTGVISGTPTAEQGASTYTVTATNSGGSTSFGIVISVNDVAPSNLSYTTPNVFTKNTAISNLTPSISGGNVSSYSITPALPSGLSLNTATGVISGTPTAVSAITTYTVTAANAFGSTTFDLQITVKDIAPSALSYTTPNVFTKDSSITPLSPTVSGGTVVQYTVSPGLPAGLSLDSLTGIISGTPTAVTASATYTVTATNSGGSVSFGVVISVKDIAPSNLSYPTPNVFTRNIAITPLNPTSSGGTVVSYSISPSLSAGLSFSTTTGIISGTPTALRTATNYTITATNSGGSTTFVVNITVNDPPPTNLSYNTPNIFTRNTAITSLNPTVSGGAVTSYSINPSLSAGLVFNTSTGRISGTPSAIRATTIYTITASNSGGSTSFDVSITVNDIPPSNLSYNTPNVYTKGIAIPNLNPSISGGPVTGYSINPALSAGLNFNTSTGRISGTPIAIQPVTVYTITATNSGGSTSFDVTITVKDVAPSGLSYNSPNVFIVGTPIAHLHPSVSGGAVVSYSISPSLPAGLTFNPSNGEIEGTPTLVSSTAIYTVTAINSGGSTSFGISITVNDIAPSSLSYPSPNVFTVGSAIANLSPTFSGNVTSFSITPALPAGLSFDTTTGIISGIPTVVSAAAIYTVTAINSGGSTSFGISITVNDIAPSSLSYTSPNVFTVGSAIANLSPTFSGNVTSFSISPALPAGLSFDTTTGVISGTPSAVAATAIYTVTANNSGGSTSFGISITVNDIAPSSLSYPSPNVFTVGSAIANLTPTFSGNVTSFSIAPALPAGLSFDTTTGIISGTPTTVTPIATYTVTEANSGGSLSFGIVITVNDIAPSSLSYTSPNVFTVGSAIASLVPTFSGNVTSFSIAPALPAGLSFDTTTGVITGTPTVVSAAAIYTVTANNSGGSTSFGVSITVNDIAPSSLSY